jgi:hypothetical protein
MCKPTQREIRFIKACTEPVSVYHVVKADMLTERHLDLLSDPFDAHECECNNCDYGYCSPAQFVDHSEREGKEV